MRKSLAALGVIGGFGVFTIGVAVGIMISKHVEGGRR